MSDQLHARHDQTNNQDGSDSSVLSEPLGDDLDTCLAWIKKLQAERQEIQEQRDHLREREKQVADRIKEVQRHFNKLVDGMGSQRSTKNGSKSISPPKFIHKTKQSKLRSREITNRELLIGVLASSERPLTIAELVEAAAQKYGNACNKFSLRTAARTLRRDRDVVFDETTKTLFIAPGHGTAQAA